MSIGHVKPSQQNTYWREWELRGQREQSAIRIMRERCAKKNSMKNHMRQRVQTPRKNRMREQNVQKPICLSMLRNRPHFVA